MPHLFRAFFILLSLAVSANAFASASVSVSQVSVNGDDVDLDSIYVQESSVIQIEFQYSADSNTTVDDWQLWIGSDLAGTLFDTGEFSGSSATISFTTDDIKSKNSSGMSGYTIESSSLYNYELTLKVEYTENNNTTTDTDGDTDSDSIFTTSDGDDDTSVNNDPTQSITIHVDEDPPGQMELNETVESGEENLVVSWSSVTKSVNGNLEAGILATFCVRKAEDIGIDVSTLGAVKADGDVDLADIDEDISDQDVEVDAVIDGDSDEPVVDGDDDSEDDMELDGDTEPTDGDSEVSDGDVTDGDVTDGDVTDGDVTDGDTSDGDTGDGDSSDSEITDCVIYAENGASGNSYRITGLENNVVYEIRAKAIDLAGNESIDWSDPVYGTPLEVDDFWEYYKRSGGKEDGGFCFIATASYGSYYAEDVALLRYFRDSVLAKSDIGRSFISWYYRVSPPIADKVADSPALASAVRAGLFPIVSLLRVTYVWAWWQQLLLMLGIFSVPLVFRWNRSRIKEVLR